MAKKATTTKRTRKTKSESADYQELNLLTGERYVPKEETINMDEYKIKKIGPFEVLDMMFRNPQQFDSLSDDQLEQFGFLLNRRFAIKYPMQAAQFSKSAMNQAWMLRAWAIYMRRVEGCNGVPRFLYTSTKKAEKEKVGIDAFDEEVINDYMKRYDLSKRDFADMLQFFNEETVAHVEHYFKMTNKNEQKKMFRETK